jgi:hypothetical protein
MRGGSGSLFLRPASSGGPYVTACRIEWGAQKTTFQLAAWWVRPQPGGLGPIRSLKPRRGGRFPPRRFSCDFGKADSSPFCRTDWLDKRTSLPLHDRKIPPPTIVTASNISIGVPGKLQERANLLPRSGTAYIYQFSFAIEAVYLMERS